MYIETANIIGSKSYIILPGEVSSLVAPVDFLLDFLLETLFLFSISDNLMLWWGVS